MSGKKALSILIIIVLLLPTFIGINPAKASAAAEDFIITENDELEKYVGDDKKVTIPDTVKQIGVEAFKNCTGIEQIILPEGLMNIEQGAFAGCSGLTELTLPTTLASFTSNCIEGCKKLKELTIPKGVTAMQWDYDQTNGLESVNVDEENEVYSSIDGVVLSKDGSQLLHYPQNKKDESYQLPDSVTDINQADFNRAKYLKHLIFNSNVTRTVKDNGYSDVNGSSFLNGTLESFSVPEENETFCDIDGVLFTKNKKEVIAYPEKRAGAAYILPKSTKIIGSWAFSKTLDSNLNLKYLLIPAGVTEIQEGTAYVYYRNGFGRDADLSLFGKRGSAAEIYANKLSDADFVLNFGYYDSAKKGENVLINAADLAMGSGSTFSLKSVVVPLTSKQTATYKTSNSAVAEITPDGYIIAKSLGSATITARTKSGKETSCTVTVMLPAPIVELKSGSPESINLTWNKIKDAKSYTVYRKSNFDDAYKKIATVTTTSYADKTFLKGSFSDYKVMANYKNSKYSSQKSMMVQLTIPDRPTDVILTATILNDTVQVDITWSPMAYSVGYEIYRSSGSSEKYSKIASIEGAFNTEFSNTLSKTGETYSYKIRAYSKHMDQVIYSDYTKPLSITAE